MPARRRAEARLAHCHRIRHAVATDHQIRRQGCGGNARTGPHHTGRIASRSHQERKQP
jgi:hypothetical protein